MKIIFNRIEKTDENLESQVENLSYPRYLRGETCQYDLGPRNLWKILTALLAVIVIFSAAGYWFIFYRNVRNTLACNSFLHIKKTGRMFASYKNIIGLYALQNSNFEFSFDYDFQPVVPVLADRSELGREPGKEAGKKNRFLNVHENTSGHTARVSMNSWSRRFFKMESKMEFPILGRVFTEEQDLIIEIDNRTPYTITDCNIFFADRIIFLGKISPRKKHKKRIPDSFINQKETIQHISDIENTDLNLPGSLYKSINENLTKEMLSLIYSQYNSKPDTLCLFGWIQSEVIPLKFTRPDLIYEHAVFLEWRMLLDET